MLSRGFVIVSPSWHDFNRLDEVIIESSNGVLVREVDYVYDAMNQKIGRVETNATGAVVSAEHYGVVARSAARSVPVAGLLSQATLDQVSVVTDGDGDVIELYVYSP
jgi:hypothetical protein